ncbi:MAG: hypothetical protein RLZ36_1664 [Pseudomonadota bacterium]|jgi:hypothetical protein
MTAKSKAFWVGVVTFLLTALVTIFREFEPGNVNAIWVIWAGFSWNYFAYAFDLGMFPRTFVELDGHGKGNPTERKVFFWGTAVIYLAFLAVAAFADK